MPTVMRSVFEGGLGVTSWGTALRSSDKGVLLRLNDRDGDGDGETGVKGGDI